MVAIVEPAKDAGSRRPAARSQWIHWLILLAYLLAAFAVTWRIWADPAAIAANDGDKVVNGDVLVDFWFMRYAATALAHGHLPALVTTAANAPQGINMMWNNTLPLPAIVLAPVTMLAGPVFSLAILLTLGFAGSAATMFLVLRRWGVGLLGAGIGGAIYGFSPALLVAAEDHYQLQFAVLPPLIIDAALRLAIGRGHPVRTGLWLGFLVSLQVFISEEMLVMTALAGAVLLLFLVIQRPSAVLGRAAEAVGGIVVALATTGLICGYALWIQLHGPLTEQGSPWHISRYGNHEANFFIAPLTVAFHGNYMQFLRNTRQWPIEVYAYLGWPILIAIAVVTVLYWRDLKIRIAGLSFAALELISMGGHRTRLFGFSTPGSFLPWHYLVRLPLLSQVVVNRLSIVSDGLAAVVIALAADRVVAAVRRQQDWRRPALASAAIICLGAMIVPILPRAVPAAHDTPAPAGWNTVIARMHLRPGAPVLVLPMNSAETMAWQALTNAPISIVGGYCIAPAHNGHASECDDADVWTPTEKAAALRFGWLLEAPSKGGPRMSLAALAIRQWRAAAVLCFGGHVRLEQFLRELLGPPTAQQNGVMGWHLTKSWLTRHHRGRSRRPRA